MTAFLIYQFSFSPLICMFHRRKLDIRINKIYKKALRFMYQNSSLSFIDLLKLNSSVTLHQRNLQVLLTKNFKLKNRVVTEILKVIFDVQTLSYNFNSNFDMRALFLKFTPIINVDISCHQILSHSVTSDEFKDFLPTLKTFHTNFLLQRVHHLHL